MDELEEILIKLNGEMFLSLFREGGFTTESMMLLKPSHLDTLVDAAQFGPRIIFEHNLNWHTEQDVHVQTAQSDEGASFANANIAEVELIYKHKHDIHYIHKKGKNQADVYTLNTTALYSNVGIINKKPAEEKPQKAAHSNLCTTGTDAVTCYLLHSVLVPTSREYKTCKQTKKQHLVKATIEDSRNSFLIWATTNCELQSKLKLMVDENYKGKSTIQPIICAIGMSLLESNEYFVYFANIFYKFDNVIKCIDVCFKIFHVLNLKYPSECKSIWFFVQQYFYDIALESHEKSTSLCAILSDLRQFKCFNNN
ncbi:PREDICTED: uncharacterized protein LOC108366200 isoform X3 [Rhagoletis zephyria]|uniref:uncharacterized protein LOC108366200 isoform X3 n=1 Tax=Rhagoletis zephyria TaxID=28612 RepID=UPI0008119207|nr:PREDICTED: uncharacterized protein LOC108366200 isoform X3 [Rhagoletis zephyria]